MSAGLIEPVDCALQVVVRLRRSVSQASNPLVITSIIGSRLSIFPSMGSRACFVESLNETIELCDHVNR